MLASKLPFFYLLLCLSGYAIEASAKPYIVGIAPSVSAPLPQTKQETQINKKRLSREKRLSKTRTPPDISDTKQSEIVPTKSEAWQAVFDYLAIETNLEFDLDIANSQLDFELKLAKGHYDMAYISPLQFIAFNDFPGYKAIVKRKAQPIRGMIFVKRNSRIKSLTELRGAIIAFPGLLDFSSSIVPRESLQRLKVDIIPRFLSSEKQVFAEVARGLFIAGGGTRTGFDAQPSEIKNNLRIIWDSPGFSPYAFVAHPRVPFFSINKIQRAMIKMNKREAEKALLPYIFVDNGFEVAKDRDWNEINLIDINSLNGSPEKVQVSEPRIGM